MSPQSFVTEYGSMDSAVTCSSSWPSLTLSWSSLLVSHEPDISSSVTSQFRPYSHSWLAPSLWLPLHPSLLAYAWPHHSSPPLAGCRHCYCCLVTKPCLSLCDPPMDCNLPDSSVHGILQAKIMEWVAISFFGGLPDLGIEPVCPALAGGFFTTKPPGKPHPHRYHELKSIHPTDNVPIVVTISLARPCSGAACPALPTSSSTTGNYFSPQPPGPP